MPAQEGMAITAGQGHKGACMSDQRRSWTEIRRLTPFFAGAVSGVDLTRSLSREEVAAIEAGMDRCAVLVFHDQQLTDEQQQAFSRNFGELEHTAGGNITKAEKRRLDPYMADVSNLDKDHKPLARDSRRRMFNLGNRLWHSDSSFRTVPAKYSLLSGRTVVDRGGHTEFADMRAAYDALDGSTKTEIEDLVCEHSLLYSRSTLGFTEFTDEERAMMRPVRHRLVRTHPVSGRKSLFLSSHIGTIVGWPVPEARAFIRDLTEHATQPRFAYSHKWRQWDLVMWDNRQLMHRVTRFDETKVRDMRRTTVAGEGPTVGQAG
jgi:alpha-ketoglutarate-dependent 2,4-dichlorophenoxyacetate dioxygenase